jgi:hypothetical protein
VQLYLCYDVYLLSLQFINFAKFLRKKVSNIEIVYYSPLQVCLQFHFESVVIYFRTFLINLPLSKNPNAGVYQLGIEDFPIYLCNTQINLGLNSILTIHGGKTRPQFRQSTVVKLESAFQLST